MSLSPQQNDQIAEYCRRNQLQPTRRLGFGVHGSVFTARNQINGRSSAVKSLEQEKFYRRERNVYRRLREFAVTHIRSHQVPQLLGYDDELLVIEMSIVSRPFVLDFAGAYLDH